jgi:hypothetical protein
MIWKMIVPTVFIFSAPLVYTELGFFVFVPYLLVWYFVMLVAWLYSTVACLFFVGLYLEGHLGELYAESVPALVLASAVGFILLMIWTET